MLQGNPRVRIATALFLATMAISHSSPARAQPQDALPNHASAVQGSSVAAQSELPDAPELAFPGQQSSNNGTDQPSQTESDEGKQTKRIFGVFPNFRSVSVNTYLPAQTSREKFTGFREESFDYSSFILVGALAGVAQLQDSTPEFHTGAPAYARYYWHNFVDQTDENLWVDFLLPTALHQDARFYTLGSGSPGRHHGFAKRAGYAFSRMLITRTDSGGSSFNYSEVVGAAVSAGIANLYYPSSNRGWSQTAGRWSLNLGIDGASFILREFWPDINHAILHNKYRN